LIPVRKEGLEIQITGVEKQIAFGTENNAKSRVSHVLSIAYILIIALIIE
jgi:hypothetical protein